jgi:hypothetical protein
VTIHPTTSIMVNAQSSAGELALTFLEGPVGLTLPSVAGLISLLQDSDPEIQSYAIQELDKVVGLYWAEISDHVVEM